MKFERRKKINKWIYFFVNHHVYHHAHHYVRRVFIILHLSTIILKRKKKYIEVEKDRQHVSSSIKKKIEKKIFIFNGKMTTSLISNNFWKFEKENNKNLKSFISSTTLKTINNVESTSKTTSKRSYNLKSSSSKFDRQTKSNKKSKNQFNYKDFHNRDYLIKFKEETHIYRVFKAFFMNNHMNFLNIKTLDLSSSTKL